MASINEFNDNGKQFTDRIRNFFSSYKIGQKLKESGAYKKAGIPAVEIMKYLVALVFTKKSMYMNYRNGTNHPGFEKDAVYDFLNSRFINWAVFLLKLAVAVIIPIRKATSEDRLCAMVIDDSLFERARSKKVELLARVRDSSTKAGKKFTRGFRLLTLGWTDGVTFIPLMFRHLSSKDIKNRYCEANQNIDKRSCGYKARKQAVSTATEVLLWMLAKACRFMVPARYVLYDSWFSYPSTMISILKMKLHSVGRLKNTTKIKYLVSGKAMTLREIYRANHKRRGRSKYLLSVQVELYNKENETADAKIVFVRNRNKRNDWIAICTTDIKMEEEQVIALYGKRWDIEVFFKVCKSYLQLCGGSQGLSYDSVTAHTAAVMVRYTMIASDKRINEDHRTITEMFHSLYDEMPDVSFPLAMELIMECLRDAFDEFLFLPDNVVNGIIDSFVDKLTHVFKQYFCGYLEPNNPLCASA